ncbi:hypothetical protein ABVK25_011800 [Lepraria finkii]|uniref:Uncharacterized protein n=1 Tax=Lepraria finkii TaxID=1340010 RepID=A0ABR4APC9_9LECA
MVLDVAFLFLERSRDSLQDQLSLPLFKIRDLPDHADLCPTCQVPRGCHSFGSCDLRIYDQPDENTILQATRHPLFGHDPAFPNVNKTLGQFSSQDELDAWRRPAFGVATFGRV